MSEVIRDIRQAMKDGELKAFYQPQFDSITSKPVSAEALARWVRADGVTVPPMAFIPELEKSGDIREVDWYILAEVCRFLTRLKNSGVTLLPVAVNFSRVHIRENDFVEKLCETVDGFGVDRSLIEVEITESALIDDHYMIKDWIKKIREAGFSVAIDDFGSGLSSLSFVKDMPADVLKIDRSLLSGNCENEKERIVLESIFYFAHRLNMTTVAEGVETKEQLGFLRTCDCKKIQGFIFAKPMPEDEFYKLCEVHKAAAETADILEIQSYKGAADLLMDVIFKRYPLVIFSNLTRNSFYMMSYENFTSTGCPSTGAFDELIIHGASSMHPDDQDIFAATFNRHHLISEYESGKSEVRLVTRQLGDDGIYRRVETTDYFVKSPSVDDLLVITLCDNLPDE